MLTASVSSPKSKSSYNIFAVTYENALEAELTELLDDDEEELLAFPPTLDAP